MKVWIKKYNRSRRLTYHTNKNCHRIQRHEVKQVDKSDVPNREPCKASKCKGSDKRGNQREKQCPSCGRTGIVHLANHLRECPVIHGDENADV